MFQAATLVLAQAALACGGSATPTPSAPAASEEGQATEAPAAFPKELEAFDYIWSAIDRTHWDPEKVGASWDAARDELRPKVVAAKTREEARAVMQELIARLGQSHFVLSGGKALESMPKGGNGTLHFDVRLIDDAIVVWRVRPGVAEGVRPGFVVKSVNGQEWAPVLAQVREALGPNAKGSYKEASAANAFVRGAVGAEAAVEFVNGKGTVTLLKTKFEPTRVTSQASFGHLQGIPLEYESREIGKDVGYIRLSIFFDPVTVRRKFREDIQRFSEKKGIVLDLRGNPGGLGAMAMGLGGHLVDKAGSKLGTMISRESKLDFVINPQPGAFAGKVAVLVDGQCASTCEIFAAGLEDIGRGIAFGTRTAGAALPSQFESLPNGELFQYATANYVSVSGRVLEHDGLTPKRVVPLSREGLLAGSDEPLDAAVAWIRE